MNLTKARACDGKRAHRTRGAARAAARELNARGAHRIAPYPCPHGRHWHIGHAPYDQPEVSLMKPDQRRAEYAAWLTALGIEPHAVPMDAEFRIDRPDDGPPTLTVEVYRTDDDGRALSGADRMREWQTVLLSVDPPGGHLPNQPSREQLLAALDRARALAGQWAMLRTHGSAAYELRAALELPGEHQ